MKSEDSLDALVAELAALQEVIFEAEAAEKDLKQRIQDHAAFNPIRFHEKYSKVVQLVEQYPSSAPIPWEFLETILPEKWLDDVYTRTTINRNLPLGEAARLLHEVGSAKAADGSIKLNGSIQLSFDKDSMKMAKRADKLWLRENAYWWAEATLTGTQIQELYKQSDIDIEKLERFWDQQAKAKLIFKRISRK